MSHIIRAAALVAAFLLPAAAHAQQAEVQATPGQSVLLFSLQQVMRAAETLVQEERARAAALQKRVTELEGLCGTACQKEPAK